MWACIIHSYIFTDYTSTRLTLPFVFTRFLNSPAINHVVFRTDEIHKLRIIMKQANHQIVIHTLIVFYSIQT